MGKFNSNTDIKKLFDFFSSIAERILGNEDLQSTCRSIMDILESHLESQGGGLFSYNEKTEELYLVAVSNSKPLDKFIRVLLGDLDNFKLDVKGKKNLLSKCVKEKKIVESSSLKAFFGDYVSRKALAFFQTSRRIKCAIGIPIIVNKKVIAVTVACFKKKHLTPTELSLIKFYANLSGLAFENSRRISELDGKYKLEKETTALLSHELKTPISIAYNSAQIYKILIDKNESKLGEMYGEFEEVHEDVKKSVGRLNQICNSIFSLREVEKSEEATLHELDLERQLEQVVSSFERKASSKGLKFNSNFALSEGTFYGGGVQLEQVITILADNAIKYTKSGQIDLNIEQKGNKIVCCITDTGIGIPDSKKKAVFDRFYRHKSLKNKFLHDIKGLGLGLYVAQKIVDQLGGEIDVQDNPEGRGSRFIVEIPVYKKLPSATS